jgi:hypothetical protein
VQRDGPVAREADLGARQGPAFGALPGPQLVLSANLLPGVAERHRNAPDGEQVGEARGADRQRIELRAPGGAQPAARERMQRRRTVQEPQRAAQSGVLDRAKACGGGPRTQAAGGCELAGRAGADRGEPVEDRVGWSIVCVHQVAPLCVRDGGSARPSSARRWPR